MRSSTGCAAGVTPRCSATDEFDHAEVAPEELRVPVADVDEAVTLIEAGRPCGAAQGGTAMCGPRLRAQLRKPLDVELQDGQHIEIVEPPVRRAAAYVPAGRAPYPSTVVMCAVTARAPGWTSSPSARRPGLAAGRTR